MPYQPFTPAEVRSILQMSEKMGGHAGERHVNPGKAYLADRQRAIKQSGLALRTSFLNFDDQVRTATAILNDPATQPEIDRFLLSAKEKDGAAFELKHVHLPTPVRMHYAIGDGAQLYPCQYFTLVLRKRKGPPRDMLIVTFFGTMGPF